LASSSLLSDLLLFKSKLKRVRSLSMALDSAASSFNSCLVFQFHRLLFSFQTRIVQFAFQHCQIINHQLPRSERTLRSISLILISDFPISLRKLSSSASLAEIHSLIFQELFPAERESSGWSAEPPSICRIY